MTGPQVTPITEIRHAWGFLVWDPSDGIVTRAPITLAQGFADGEIIGGEDVMVAGTVLGQITDGASAAAAGTNTGNGTFGAITNAASAPAGAYVATCVQATAGAAAETVQAHEGNVGTGAPGTLVINPLLPLGEYRIELTATGATAAFDVFTPAGVLLGSGHVGTAFSAGGLGFTLTNAGTMTAGDSWDIVVTDTGAAFFSLVDPNGKALPNIQVGAAYANELIFTLSQGVTKFALADSFTITLAAGSGQYAPYDPTAVNGLQIACAILGSYRKDVTSASQTAGALVRGPARINSSELVWGTNVTTTPQQTAALASLAALGIQNTI